MKINEQNKVATKCRVDPFAALMENVIHLHTFAFALILEERVASGGINWKMLLGMLPVFCAVYLLSIVFVLCIYSIYYCTIY